MFRRIEGSATDRLLPYPPRGILVNAEAALFALIHLLWTAPLGHAEAPAGASVAVVVAPDALSRYEAVRVALVADDRDGAVTAARELAGVSDAELAASATALAAAADLPGMRMAFGEVSRLLVLRIAATRPAPKILVYHCPMASGYAWWIQAKSGLANPYMGTAMPGCGEETSLKAAVRGASAQ